MAAQKLAIHICWQDSKTTNMVVEIVCEIIADTNEEDFPHLFSMLSILINMRDGLDKFRAEKISFSFMRALAENIQYSSMCIKCLEFLSQVRPMHLQSQFELTRIPLISTCLRIVFLSH